MHNDSFNILRISRSPSIRAVLSDYYEEIGQYLYSRNFLTLFYSSRNNNYNHSNNNNYNYCNNNNYNYYNNNNYNYNNNNYNNNNNNYYNYYNRKKT